MKNFGDAKPSLEELAHHGVKGQKWGVRKAVASISRGHQLNKASRQHERQTENAAIDAARARESSGQNKATLQKAKAQYKSDKQRLGRHAAKVRLNKTRDKVALDRQTANSIKHGKEHVASILGLIGGVSLGVAANTYINTRGL